MWADRHTATVPYNGAHAYVTSNEPSRSFVVSSYSSQGSDGDSVMLDSIRTSVSSSRDTTGSREYDASVKGGTDIMMEEDPRCDRIADKDQAKDTTAGMNGPRTNHLVVVQSVSTEPSSQKTTCSSFNMGSRDLSLISSESSSSDELACDEPQNTSPSSVTVNIDVDAFEAGFDTFEVVPCPRTQSVHTDDELPVQASVSPHDFSETLDEVVLLEDVLSVLQDSDGEEGSVGSHDNSMCDKFETKWEPNLSVDYSLNSIIKHELDFVPVTPVDRIPYVHGSYASAAPHMIRDVKWMRILRRLLPANHADAVEIVRVAEEASTRSATAVSQMARIMKWAENNPVVAAYGIVNSDSGSETHSPMKQIRKSTSCIRRRSSNSTEHGRSLPVLEWDVFLDPALVKKVEAAMDALAQMSSDDSSADYQAQIAADIEIDRQVARLIKRMMLAHGSASHLVSEALGVGSRYNFMKLVEEGESQLLYRRKKAERDWKRSGLHFSRNGMDLGGKTWLVNVPSPVALVEIQTRSVVAGKASAKPAGWNVERWLALFLRAIHLGKAADGVFNAEDDETSPKHDDNETLRTRPPFCGMFLCFGIEDPNSAKVDHGKTSMAITAKKIEAVLGSPLRIILDLKSRRVPPRVWARVIDNMRSRGLVVEGLGSFDIDELRSVKELCASNVTEVRFFHSAGDLQKACHAKEVQVGDTVFFNAGSLIWEKPSNISNVMCGQKEDISQAVLDDDDIGTSVRFQPFAYPNDDTVDRSQLNCESTLQDYKNKFRLNIGCYVQEFSICERNLDALTRFLNKHKSVYNLGLAFGGINGQCPVGLTGDGYWNQRYMGRSWDRDAKPTDEMHLLQPEDHRLVQKAALAGAWGALGTINNAGEDSHDISALQLGACATQNNSCG